MAKKKLTVSDLDKKLRDFGFKEGDELTLPSDEKANESTSTTESGESEGGEGDGEDGGGGGNNPPKKPPF